MTTKTHNKLRLFYMLFKQRSARLANGTKVKEGDVVEFTNSDGEVCRGVISRDASNPKRLYFWNRNFEIEDYKSARKVEAI